MKRQNLRTVSLIVVTFTYLLVGAAIFGYLESENEVFSRAALEVTERLVRGKYNISDEDFEVITATVLKGVTHKAGIQWKFSGAFYFATTVVTTIGYGHSTPETVAGRSFCMVYALIGIPLGLVMFQSIGERLNTFVGCTLRHAKRCFKAKNPEVTQTNLVMVVSVLSTILMSSMAAVFASYERWDYFDALYYCFITLTTIGFGDLVALQKDSALQSKPEYVALSLIFILFGLSVVSSAVNLLVLKFLTLNTEDERRDEQLRFTASQNPIQLEGDVITSACAPRPHPLRVAPIRARQRPSADPWPAHLYGRIESSEPNTAEEEEELEEELAASRGRRWPRLSCGCPAHQHSREESASSSLNSDGRQQVAGVYSIGLGERADYSSSGSCSCASRTSAARRRPRHARSRVHAPAWPSGSHAPVARLVCKCCCQHSECVQLAIRSEWRRRTSGKAQKSEPEEEEEADPHRLGLQRKAIDQKEEEEESGSQ